MHRLSRPYYASAWVPVWFFVLVGCVAIALSLSLGGAYLGGVVGGLLAHRLGYTRSPYWKGFVRVSLFGFASLTSLVALWGFRASNDLGVLLAVQAGTWAALLTTLRRWRGETGLGGLNGWAGTVNTGAWLTSVSSDMGVSANQAAVTADVGSLPAVALMIRLIRKGAPRTQSLKTSAIDYAVPIAALIGLALNLLTGDRPSWATSLLAPASVLLAFLSMCSASGSLAHALSIEGARAQKLSKQEMNTLFLVLLNRCLAIVGVGVVCWWVGLLPPALAPLLLFAIFSAPTVSPPSLAILYGYSETAFILSLMRIGLPVATLPLAAWVFLF